MHTWIVQGGISAVMIAIALPLALLPLVNRVYRDHGRFAGWPAVVVIAAISYACGVVAYTLFPLPEATELFCEERSLISYWNTQPLRLVSDIGQETALLGFPSVLSSFVFLQVAMNVVLFLPLGFLLRYWLRWGFGQSVLAGLALSLLIEATQGTAMFGVYACPYRVAEFDDLITNTTGTAVGWLIAAALIRRLPDTEPAPVDDLDEPSLLRRIIASSLDLLAVVVGGALITAAVFAVLRAFVPDADLSLGAVAWWLRVLVMPTLVGLIVPLLRTDSATPGQAAVDLALVDVDLDVASNRQVVVRWLVRWVPAMLMAGVIEFVWLIAVYGLAEAVIADRHQENRSLAGIAARTRTVTLRSLQAREIRARDRHLLRS